MSDINESQEVNGTGEDHSNTKSETLNTTQNAEGTNPDADVVEADSVVEDEKAGTENGTEEHDEILNEIEESNAEDAEDEGNKDRHKIEVKAYDTMSLEALAIELEKLLSKEKVQAIKSHVDAINAEFKTKFQTLVDEKKEDFLNDGGNEIDFYYSSPVQKRFNY